MSKKPSFAINIEAEQLKALDALSRETRVPRAAIVRFAIDLYLREIDRQRPPTTRLLAPFDEPKGKTLAEVFADEDE